MFRYRARHPHDHGPQHSFQSGVQNCGIIPQKAGSQLVDVVHLPWHVFVGSAPQPLLVQPEIAVCTQPLPTSQLSVVHGSLSSQVAAPPGLQKPPEQTSFSVQGSPSSHEPMNVLCWHFPVCALQKSCVQLLPSSQLPPVLGNTQLPNLSH